MKNKIISLHIDSFRGATRPLTVDFDPDKKITMIFGENGNGKSTIADAVIALFTDSLGSMQDKSSIDKTFITSLSIKPEKLKILLKSKDAEYSARHSTSAKALTRTANTSDYTIRELRRSQIFTLIDSAPSKRYEALREYIDVENIFKAEEELRKLNKSVKAEYEQLVGIISSASDALNKAWEAEGKPGKSWKEWAKDEAEKNVTKETDAHNKLVEINNTWGDTTRSNDNFNQNSKRQKELLETTHSLLKKIEEKEKENKEQSSELLKILKDAKKYIESRKEIKTCPVCDSSIKNEALLIKLNDQIVAMNELDTLNNQYTSSKASLDKTETLLQKSKEETLSLIETLFSKIDSSKSLDKKLSDTIFTSLEEKKNDERLEFLTKSLIQFNIIFGYLSEVIDRKRKAIDQHNLIKTHYHSIINSTDKATQTEKLVKVAEASLKIVEGERKDFIDKELASISADVESLYSKMHKDEGLGGIKLFLNPKMKNSLELKAKFHTTGDISPQSLYSESHLDTLGLCIFIALAKKYGSENTILVLDDVLMSVDDKHLDKFINLIHEETENFAHVLITTHYRPWRDRYRHHRAPANEVHFIELKEWNIEKGIRIKNGKNDLHDLTEVLYADDMDRQSIANRAGTLLENILDIISVQYMCRLPRKPGNDFGLRELLDAPSSKLLKVFKVEHLGKTPDGKADPSRIEKEIELKPIFEKLKQLAVVRNMVGAHFNLDGSLISDKDVKDFGEATLELANSLVCPECGSMPDRNKSGSFFETKSGFIRLYPIIEPN